MTWRPFQEFNQSRLRAELRDVRQDVEAGRQLSSQFLQQLKPIVGCLTMVVETGDDVDRHLRIYGKQLEEAYAALEVLRAEGCVCWGRLPETASWMRIIQARLRTVIRTMPVKMQSLPNAKQQQFVLDLRRLWAAVREAEQRVTPPIDSHSLC